MNHQLQLFYPRHTPPANPPVEQEEKPGTPMFTLERFNPRRHARGSEAAEMKVTWPDGDVEFLWMSKKDIKANMKEWGCSDGLLDALNAYRSNLPI